MKGFYFCPETIWILIARDRMATFWLFNLKMGKCLQVLNIWQQKTSERKFNDRFSACAIQQRTPIIFLFLFPLKKKIFICSAHVHHKLWIAFPMAVDPGDTIICQRHPLRDWTIRRPRLAGLSIIQTVKPAAKSYALAVCQWNWTLFPFSFELLFPLANPQQTLLFSSCTIYYI